MPLAFITNIQDYVPCIRCGVCCATDICNYGIENEYYVCQYLIKDNEDNNVTSCKLVTDRVIKPKDIGINSGCKLRKLPECFEYFHNIMLCKTFNNWSLI